MSLSADGLEPLPETLAGVGARARELRLSLNLTRAEVAARSGVGLATIARFERAGQATLENVLRVAVVLGAEEGFRALFARPRYRTIDEAFAQEATKTRKRARRAR